MTTETPAPKADIVARLAKDIAAAMDISWASLVPIGGECLPTLAPGQQRYWIEIARAVLRAERVPERWRPTPEDGDDALPNLVSGFASALLGKLYESEAKYGWQNGWMRDDWRDDLLRDIRRHVEKGDPRDVAAYCAFAWHHGWSLASRARPAEGEVAELVERGRARMAFLKPDIAETPTMYGPADLEYEEKLIDALDRLARRVAELEGERDEAQERAHYATGTADLAMKHRDAAEAHVKELEAGITWRDEERRNLFREAETAQAQLAAALEVLEPFAAWVDRLDTNEITANTGDACPISCNYERVSQKHDVTIGHFRAARDFIRSNKGGE